MEGVFEADFRLLTFFGSRRFPFARPVDSTRFRLTVNGTSGLRFDEVELPAVLDGCRCLAILLLGGIVIVFWARPQACAATM